MPYFVSPNLEAKMNDYLNDVIRKSRHDHEEKVIQMEFQADLKERPSNAFMRNMKKNLKRKSQSVPKEEP